MNSLSSRNTNLVAIRQRNCDRHFAPPELVTSIEARIRTQTTIQWETPTICVITLWLKCSPMKATFYTTASRTKTPTPTTSTTDPPSPGLCKPMPISCQGRWGRKVRHIKRGKMAPGCAGTLTPMSGGWRRLITSSFWYLSYPEKNKCFNVLSQVVWRSLTNLKVCPIHKIDWNDQYRSNLPQNDANSWLQAVSDT